MRRVLGPKWVAWHLLAAVLAVTFFRLGLWQWHRAVATNSPQSMGYALQWPAFAIFGLFFWWRTVRDAIRPRGESTPREPKVRPAVARPRAVTDDEDPDMAAYNRYLSRLAEIDETAERNGR